MSPLSFFRLIALWGMLAACTFSNYQPPLAQAVAPGYKVVRVLPSHPKPYTVATLEPEVAVVAVKAPPSEPEPAVAAVETPPEPEVSEEAYAPAVVIVEPPVPAVTEEDLVEPTPAVAPEPQADNRYALGEEALSRSAYADAFPYFLSLIEDHPTNADFFFRAGFSAFMAGAKNQGESWFPQATSLLRRCLELHPQHIEGQFLLGCVYDWSEEWFAAEKAYKRAIEMDPSHRKAIQNLAALYQRQGLDAKARELLILLRRL